MKTFRINVKTVIYFQIDYIIGPKNNMTKILLGLIFRLENNDLTYYYILYV